MKEQWCQEGFRVIKELKDEYVLFRSQEVPSDAPKIPVNSTIEVRYSGYLYDGEAFKDLDNNLQGESLSFKLTYSMVIDAWEIALPYAHPGETFEIITSPKYAYGGKGCLPKIPANAILKYRIEVVSVEKEPQTVQEFLDYGTQLKMQGNELFRNGNVEEAFEVYGNILDILRDLEPSKDEEVALRDLTILALLNSAACGIRLKEFHSAKSFCNRILDISSRNVKAFYRRAQANCGLGDFANSLKDIDKAISLNPKDEQLKREKQNIEKRKQQYDAHFAKMMAKMGQLYSQGK